MPASASSQLRRWGKDIENAVDQFDRKDRLSILRKAALPVKKTAAALAPKRQASQPSGIGLNPNPRYKSAGRRGRRSKRGDGKIVARYLQGNLKKSLKVLTFRNSKDAFVGPGFSKKSIPIYGRTIGTADGYYAQMIYGSKAAFKRKVLDSARDQNASQVIGIVKREAQKKITQYSGKGA